MPHRNLRDSSARTAHPTSAGQARGCQSAAAAREVKPAARHGRSRLRARSRVPRSSPWDDRESSTENRSSAAPMSARSRCPRPSRRSRHARRHGSAPSGRPDEEAVRHLVRRRPRKNVCVHEGGVEDTEEVGSACANVWPPTIFASASSKTARFARLHTTSPAGEVALTRQDRDPGSPGLPETSPVSSSSSNPRARCPAR